MVVFEINNAWRTEKDKECLVHDDKDYYLSNVYPSRIIENKWTLHWKCRVCLIGSLKSTRYDNVNEGENVNIIHINDHTIDCTPLNIVKRLNELARYQFLKRVTEDPLINIANLHRLFRDDLRNGNIMPVEYIEANGVYQFSSLVELGPAINRMKLKTLPALPQGIEELDENLIIQAGFHQYRCGNEVWKRFLLFVEVFNGRKIICFASDAFLEKLVNADTISLDGTFKVVPEIINMNNGQLLTMHVMIQDHLCVPCVYAFLPWKTQNCYNVFFNRLQEECHVRNMILQPTHILCDFESGLLPALNNSFPEAEVWGCYFHFCQSVYKYIGGRAPLREWYINNYNNFKRFVRMLQALAFLSPEQVIDTYNSICILYAEEHEEVMHNEQVGNFLEYFESQWLENAHIPLEQWNVFNRNNGMERTNNGIEGWHNRLVKQLGVHPNCWKAFQGLIDEEKHFEYLIGKLSNGGNIRRQNSVYLNMQNGIEQDKNAYIACGMINPIEYTQQVSWRIVEAYFA